MTKRNPLKLIHSADDNYVDPEKLQTVLKIAHVHETTFRSEKDLKRYRHMLYTINKQGEYRYRTMRSEASMWAIAIWRMR